MTAPTISNIGMTTRIAGNLPSYIASDATVTGGTGYGGGSITFSLSSAVSGDIFALKSATDVNASGAISLDAGVVYLGTGSGRMSIGTVDATLNGINGNALKINFTGIPISAFANSSFETDVTGWTIGSQRVILGTDSINGHLTPVDPTYPPNAGDDAGGITSMSYNWERSTTEHSDGAASLRLYNSGTTGAGYDVVHGPYAYSNTFHAGQGDVLYFDWRAFAGGDAYDAFGYLMNADTGESIVILNETGANASGQKPWTTASVVVPEDGNWFFTFVSGTYDFSGGRAVGGSLFVDNFKVLTSNVTDAVVQSLLRQMTLDQGDGAGAHRYLNIAIADGSGTDNDVSTRLEIDNIPVISSPVVLDALTADHAGPRIITQAELLANATDDGAMTVANLKLWDPLESTCRHASLSIL